MVDSDFSEGMMEILTLETEGIKTTLNIDPTDIQTLNIETGNHEFLISVTEMIYGQTIEPMIPFRIKLEKFDFNDEVQAVIDSLADEQVNV